MDDDNQRQDNKIRITLPAAKPIYNSERAVRMHQGSTSLAYSG